MLLTKCAACAAELGLTSGKKCGRCATRYCGAACQEQHWKEGGHDQLCKQIKKSGGAEQYYANKMCAEAVAVAVAKCADDTAGQTCYICTQALHWKTKEGLVRMCACRGTAGFVHVSCLAEQARVLMDEAEQNNLREAFREAGKRWYVCSLCEQRYHGVVACALGWASWKMFLGRPKEDGVRCSAMEQLANGLVEAEQYEDALSVQEATLAMKLRLDYPEEDILIVQGNLAGIYAELGHLEKALRLKQDVYSGRLKLHGEEHDKTLLAAYNYANSLLDLKRFEEGKALLRRMLPVARGVLGDSNRTTLMTRWNYAKALVNDPGATLDDIREAVTSLEELAPYARRVLGGAHPTALGIGHDLSVVRKALDAQETPRGVGVDEDDDDDEDGWETVSEEALVR